MSLQVETAPGAAAAYKKSDNSSFAALPAATYQATISGAEIIKFANSGPYESKRGLNLKLRIVEDAPVGAKRVFFLRVPLFQKFLPSAKYPDGAPAFGYFQFGKAIGVSDEAVEAGQLPDIREFLGKRVGVKIKLYPVGSEGQSYHINQETGEPEAWNEADSIFPPQKGGAVASGIPAASAPAVDPFAPVAVQAAPAAAVDPFAPATVPSAAPAWLATPDPVLAGAVAEGKSF